MSTSGHRAAHIWLDVEDGSWFALGRDPDGNSYAAVADTLKQLTQQVRESAEVEGWPSLVLYR